MRVLSLLLGLAALSTGAATARADCNLRVSLTGMLYLENELAPPGLAQLSSLARIAYGDVRGRVGCREILQRVDFRADFRSRLSSDVLINAPGYNFEQKFDVKNQPYLAEPPTQIGYRGYTGGPEFFDLREAWVGVRISSRLYLVLGRLIIVEADAIKVDAAQLRVHLSERWGLSAFFGGYPNPYSRYLLTDYDPPCGNGVAQGVLTVELPTMIRPNPPRIDVASDPCQQTGPQLALAGGVTASYRYPQIPLQGSLGFVGSFFGGPGDGGPVIQIPDVTDRVANVLPENDERDAPRIYLSWTNHVSPTRRFDLFSNLVVDLFGSSGLQLTRALLSATLRLLAEDRLTLRAHYSYMSSLGIGMYLRRMFYNRSLNGTTLGSLGVVENNLTLLRTGRHEGRAAAELRLLRRLLLYLEGRLRQRSLLGGDSNADVYSDARYTEQTADLAGDLTLGIRDSGSLRRVRANLAYTFLQNFRAQNHVLRIGAGINGWAERIDLQVEYVLLATTDGGAGQSQCAANLNQAAIGLEQVSSRGVSQINPALSAFFPDCFGRRQGTSHEAGLTLTWATARSLLLLLDYRFSAILTDPQADNPVPTVLAHALLTRIEIGF